MFSHALGLHPFSWVNSILLCALVPVGPLQGWALGGFHLVAVTMCNEHPCTSFCLNICLSSSGCAPRSGVTGHRRRLCASSGRNCPRLPFLLPGHSVRGCRAALAASCHHAVAVVPEASPMAVGRASPGLGLRSRWLRAGGHLPLPWTSFLPTCSARCRPAPPLCGWSLGHRLVTRPAEAWLTAPSHAGLGPLCSQACGAHTSRPDEALVTLHSAVACPPNAMVTKLPSHPRPGDTHGTCLLASVVPALTASPRRLSDGLLTPGKVGPFEPRVWTSRSQPRSLEEPSWRSQAADPGRGLSGPRSVPALGACLP